MLSSVVLVFESSSRLLRATAYAIARICYRPSSVCLCLSHGWISQKRL